MIRRGGLISTNFTNPFLKSLEMSNSELESLLLNFMAIDSTTGQEGIFAEFVAKNLESAGWNIQRQPLALNPERINILATRGNSNKRIMLNTHLDTVPPYIPASQDSTNIYGRGSNDAKGQLACMVSAANELAKRNPVLAEQLALLFVVGEEVDHVGMVEANKLLDGTVEYLIVGEPTELKFATIQKGALKVLLKSTGKAGHSGYLSSGESAIHKLIPILNDILNYSWPKDKTIGDTTLNVGLIQGGQAQNAWAAEAQANIFFRVTTSVQDILNKLKQIVNGRCEVELLTFNEPVLLNGTPLPGLEETQANFNTDFPYYEYLDKLKAKFLFGAGSITNAHSADEFVPKKELQICRDSLIELVEKLLSK